MTTKYITLVIFPLAKWDAPYSSTTFSLAKEFSKNNKVIYVDAPVTLKDLLFNLKRPDIKRRISRLIKGEYIQQFNDNLSICYLPPVIPINFLSQGRIYRFFKAINERIVFKFLRKRLSKLGHEKYIYVNIFNPFYNHKSYLRPLINIYYTVDNIAKSSYIHKHGVWLEKQSISSSDISLGTSLMLVNKNKKINPNFFYLPNATSLKIFDPTKSYRKPDELHNITSQIIIFTGHLDKRTDLSLLHSILENNKDKTVVIVGLISLKEDTLQKLKSFNNIQFVPPKPIEALPAFLFYADCAIIPYKNNELTNSIYPLKINEYLAMGIPVVSTCFSEDIMQFNTVISLTDDADNFCQLINYEINHNSPEKQDQRKDVAKSNTWEKRVEKFWEIINRHLKELTNAQI